MTVECSNCGESFDVDRDTNIPGQDTSRCPACGTKNDVDGASGEAATVTVDREGGDGTHVHIHIHKE